MTFHDHFSGHATDYARHRPSYPDALFAHLADLVPARELAWDCGAGNGQAAAQLAQHFERVVATDASSQQIAAATRARGVRFAVAAAECSPLAEGAVDLVVSAQAVHWFDLERFYAEVRRVTRPGGVLGVWSYAWLHVDPEFDGALMRLAKNIVGPYWPPERDIVEIGYQTLEFPFEEIESPHFEMLHEWTLGEVLSYVRTWSAVRRYIGAEGRDPLELVEDELVASWGEAEKRAVCWPLSVRFGRVE